MNIIINFLTMISLGILFGTMSTYFITRKSIFRETKFGPAIVAIIWLVSRYL